MNNILMVTSLYPLPTKENNCTYVCHFFTREWVTMGYNVVVIHSQSVHCWAWHLLVRFFGKSLKNIMGGGNYYARKIKHTEHYVMDDVPVYRVPIYKFIPRGRYSYQAMQTFVDETCKILSDLHFAPDIIVGHMNDIEQIPELNKRLHTRTCMVVHGVDMKIKERYSDWRELINSYDAWGFRSAPLKNCFESTLIPVKQSFYCYSGIPSKYLTEKNSHSFIKPLSRFIFIGELVERKYPISLLEAIPLVVNEYNITFVGEGQEREKLEKHIDEHNIGERVQLVGRVQRDLVTKYLDDADCFIMISRNEAYGLVYLEAMARGCIVIASRNEGFDGIIIDGENGFLCEAGNANELSKIIRRINAMTPEERLAVSENGLETARRMTDFEMAKDYVNKLGKI